MPRQPWSILEDEGKSRRGPIRVPLVIDTAMIPELNVLALCKGRETFIYVYDDASRHHLLNTLCHQAADPDVSLNWFDASVLRTKIEEQTQSARSGELGQPR